MESISKKKRPSDLLTFVKTSLNMQDISNETEREWKNNIKFFSEKISRRWELSSRKLHLFLQKYESWLDKDDIIFKVIDEKDPNFNISQPKVSGRPKKTLQDCSFQTKKRKVQHITKNARYEEVTFAAQLAVRASGRRDAAILVKELCESAPEVATSIKHLRQEQSSSSVRQYNKEEALALYLDCKLTKNAYIIMRKRALEAGHRLYPSYYELQKAKVDCCPPKEFISINDNRVDVCLQQLLDHTAKRLAIVQDPVIRLLVSSGVTDFNLISKWGGDGSSGHSRYKQNFNNSDADDEYLFGFSVVLIKMHPQNQSQKIVWQNEKTSSTRLCRPIKFLFHKETVDMVRTETENIKNEISNLQPTKTIVGETEINIHHQLLLTMVDGKICNTLTNTKSAQTCYICGSTPKLMNKEIQNNKIDINSYSFGMSTLHCWIRSFECLLHISYKLNIKKWQAKSLTEKNEVKERKISIQRRFKQEMGLIVDMPKPGFGSTNDGNTARKFFKNPEKSANITGLDKNLIHKFSIILQTLSSDFEINIHEFEKYVADTKALYLDLYSWYYMPVTVHKLLVHGGEIIRNCILPIGQLSEEAQEARNKDCRRFREFNTQKISRNATNKDLLTMLLISSDPLVNSYREKTKKSKNIYSTEVLELLKCPSLEQENIESTTRTSINDLTDDDTNLLSDSSISGDNISDEAED